MKHELDSNDWLAPENTSRLAQSIWGEGQSKDTDPGRKLPDWRPFPYLWYEPKNGDDTQKKNLSIDLGGKHHDVIVAITLPDGGKISRVTEELPWSKGSY